MYRPTLFLALAAILSLGTEAQAQQTTTEQTHDQEVRDELRSLVTGAEDARTDRAVVSDFLEREDVERAADDGGIDLERLKDGVGTLGNGDASRLAERVRDVENQLAGGNTIVLTSSTVIIILLVILVIAVA